MTCQRQWELREHYLKHSTITVVFLCMTPDVCTLEVSSIRVQTKELVSNQFFRSRKKDIMNDSPWVYLESFSKNENHLPQPLLKANRRAELLTYIYVWVENFPKAL